MKVSQRIRVVTAAVQVFATLALLVVAGDVTAQATERQQVATLHARLAAADKAFHEQVARSIAEGVAEETIAPVKAAEAADYGQSMAKSYFVDRAWLATLASR